MLHRAVFYTFLFVFAAGSAVAIPIASTNLDTLVTGGLHSGPTNDFFEAAAPPPDTIGTIVNNVYYDGSLYTYTHQVTPSIDNISEFNTAFEVLGFTEAGSIAGFSFSESLAAGGPGDGTGFSIELDPDGTIDWNLDPNNKFWGSGESLTFFFQSIYAPGVGAYNLINSEVGTATSFAPTAAVPEPTTLLLLGGGLALVFLRRRRS